MGKRAALSDFAAVKPGSEPAESHPKPAGTNPEPKADNRKGQTLRLSPAAWRQLKVMAMDEGATVHQVLVDAVDDAFRKRGKPAIAQDGQPDRKKA